MAAPSRMPRHDVRNDGTGPYAIFYCDKCGREFRSTPSVADSIAKGVGRQALGGLLRNVPIFGDALADNAGQDPRYTYNLTTQQLDAAWGQVKEHFRECPTCNQIVCLSDFDEQSGFCADDSPRKDQIAEARGEQAGAALKGLASAFGLGGVIQQASDAAQKAATSMARCPKDGTVAAPGTKFCPECGAAMVQPAAAVCPKCGAQTSGAKFCPECGAKLEAPAPAGVCPKCGTQTQGAKFCPNCGNKM